MRGGPPAERDVPDRTGTAPRLFPGGDPGCYSLVGFVGDLVFPSASRRHVSVDVRPEV